MRLLHTVSSAKREEQLSGLNGTFGTQKQRTTPYASPVIDYSRLTA
jgi:hypothetical protein